MTQKSHFTINKNLMFRRAQAHDLVVLVKAAYKARWAVAQLLLAQAFTQ